MSRKSGLTTISLSPELREALASLKTGGRSFGDVFKVMIAEKSLGGWREKLELRDEDILARVRARKARIAGGAGLRRDPSEQRLLAEAARDRWERWTASGRVRKRDNRRWKYEARSRGGSAARIRRTR